MVLVAQWLVVLAAVVSLGWAAVKCCDLIAETFSLTIQRQLRKTIVFGAVVIAIILTLVVGAIALSAAIWGTGCEPGLDSMSCPTES